MICPYIIKSTSSDYIFLIEIPTILICCVRYYGGWAAPQIYFLGFAGVVKFGNIRIGGLSGIYKANHYRSGNCICISDYSIIDHFSMGADGVMSTMF